MVIEMAKKPTLNKAESNVQEPVNPGAPEEVTVGANAVSVLDDLEAELSGLTLEGTHIPAGNPTTMIEDLQALDSALDEVSAGAVIAEEQTSSLAPVSNVEELRKLAQEEQEEQQEPVAATTPAESPKNKAPQTRRIATMGMKKSEALVKALGNRAADFLTINLSDADLPDAERQAKIDELLATIDDSKKTPIKIQEKVINFYAHLSNGAQLSNYTVMAIQLLVKDGELTSKTLKDAYEARPYSQGTASSQATQMMKLLPLLGLAVRNGQKLTINPDSVLLPSLKIA